MQTKTEDTRCNTEVIAISSGKGGTGKTVTAACLGYTLINADHKVLMIDADPGTDGLSLYLLGREGKRTIKDIEISSTFCGALDEISQDNSYKFKSHPINRISDHEVIYDTLISGKGIYTDYKREGERTDINQLSQSDFRLSVTRLFQSLRDAGEYDYVIVDTRGGFTYESTDICALADSFIVITEPDASSFNQDSNLINRISIAAGDLKSKAFLRGIIVNKTVHGEEQEFRLWLEKALPMIQYRDTYPVPLDVEVINSYRTQKMPYITAPGSQFASATLSAFSYILHLVTAGWSKDRILKWNGLVKKISRSYNRKTKLAGMWRSLRFAVPIMLAFVVGLFATNFVGQVKSWLLKGERDLITRVYDRNETNFARKNIFLELYEKGNLTFDGIDLSGFDLRDMNLANVRLRRANLSYAEMVAINLRGADLEGADLRKANLNSADLREANLSGANLSGAELNLASLKNAILDSVDLRGANLFQSDVSEEQMDAAILDEFTILPNDPRAK